MARIRSVHPGLWTDERFVTVSRDARLLMIGLWGECDDKGAFEWKPLQIKMRLCAGDDVTLAAINEWLAELEGANLARRYTIGGTEYGAVRNFCKWQRPKKPNDLFPMPPEFRTYCGYGASETESGSEPDAIKPGPGSPPVPNQSPTGGEKPPQRKEEGGKEGGRGEEKKETSLRDAKKAIERGCRLPTDWNPGDDGWQFAIDHGLDPKATFARFRDYWIAAPGQKGVKLDWQATWRNWCRNQNGYSVAPGLPLNGHHDPLNPRGDGLVERTPANPTGRRISPMTGFA